MTAYSNLTPTRAPRRAGSPIRPAVRSSRRPTGKFLLTILGQHGLRWVLDCAPIYVAVLHGIEAALTDHGYRMMVRQAATQGALETLADEADGLIILGFEDFQTASLNIAHKVPTVWTMGSPLKFQGDHILPDHLRVGAIAATHLLEKGHRRFALIGSSTGTPASQMNLRNDGFFWTVEQSGGEVQMLLDARIVRRGSGEHHVDGSVLDDAVRQIVERSPRPTALFIENDMLSPGIYQRLYALGLRPQREIEIVTCNNEACYLRALDPKPTVIDVQPQMIGRMAVEQLLWRTSNRNAPTMRTLVEPQLVPGKSKMSPVQA